MLTFCHLSIPSRHLTSQAYLSKKWCGSMAFPVPSFQIETKSSLVTFGPNSFACKEHTFTVAPPITLKEQMEVINRCLETFLRYFSFNKPQSWSTRVPWVEYWYNTTFHALQTALHFGQFMGETLHH